MKIKELEKIVNGLGLACDWGNQGQVIMQIWQPHKNGDFKIDSKYYSAETLSILEVKKLNSKFEKLLTILKKHKIKVRDVEIIENGVVSQINLMVRYETLMQFENRTLNFEIEDFEDWSGGKWINYNNIIPDDIGYGVGFYDFDISRMFADITLRKHERDLVITNIDEIFKRFSGMDNLEWIINFVREQNNVEPLEIALEKGVFSPKQAIEFFFGEDEIYYQKKENYTRVFKILSTYKVDDLDINKNSNSIGYLPDIITNSPKIFKQVLTNWEFEYDSGQRVLIYLVQDEHFEQFKQFINIKDPKKYYFDDWYDLQEYVLHTIGIDDLKLVQKLFDDKWMEMKHIDDGYIFDFIRKQLTNETSITNEPIIIREFLKIKSLEAIDKLLGIVLEISRDEHFFIPEAVQPFIDNPTKLDFEQADAEIMKYLDDEHPLKKQLIDTDGFVQYLVNIGKVEYLPKTVTDVFLF